MSRPSARARRFVVASIVSACAVLSAGTATASNINVHVNITSAGLSFSSSASPSVSATLGADQTASYTIPSSVSDETGSGAGWNVTITSTTFSTGGASPTTLPTNASTATGVTTACSSGYTCTDPTNSVSYPLAVPAAASPPTAVELFNAATDTGMGAFSFTPTVGVAVLANDFAGTYSSTVTIGIVSGP